MEDNAVAGFAIYPLKIFTEKYALYGCPLRHRTGDQRRSADYSGGERLLTTPYRMRSAVVESFSVSLIRAR